MRFINLLSLIGLLTLSAATGLLVSARPLLSDAEFLSLGAGVVVAGGLPIAAILVVWWAKKSIRSTTSERPVPPRRVGR